MKQAAEQLLVQYIVQQQQRQQQEVHVRVVGWDALFDFARCCMVDVEACCSVALIRSPQIATDGSFSSSFCTNQHLPLSIMATQKSTRKTIGTGKAETKAAATTKRKAKKKVTFFPKKKVAAKNATRENLDPQCEKQEMGSPKKPAGRSRVARGGQKKVSYHENSGSDTDPISDDEDGSDVEQVEAPKKKKTAAKKETKAQTTKSSEHPKINSPSVRPPDCSWPRAIVGRRVEPSHEDWRVESVQDY
jgi:hypothetical protein